MDILRDIGFSFGLVVIALVIYALPLFVVAKIWNKLMPTRTINTWFPSLLANACLFCMSLLLIPEPAELGNSDRWIIVPALLVSLLFCFSRYRRSRAQIRKSQLIPQL